MSSPRESAVVKAASDAAPDSGSGARPVGDAPAAVSPATTPTHEVAPGPVPLKERVLTLYRQGMPVERIAARVGTAVSEIELIVSLNERK